MEFEQVAAAVEGIPFMSPVLGRRVYDHVRRTRPEQVLELGTAHGVSAAYIAAALEANGVGHVTTVDHGGAAFDPPPEQVLAEAQLAHRVTIVREHSSYNWFLKEQVEQSSDQAGNCVPRYDFCYLDGSKNFNIDGVAVVLIEKLLRRNGRAPMSRFVPFSIRKFKPSSVIVSEISLSRRRFETCDTSR